MESGTPRFVKVLGHGKPGDVTLRLTTHSSEDLPRRGTEPVTMKEKENLEKEGTEPVAIKDNLASRATEPITMKENLKKETTQPLTMKDNVEKEREPMTMSRGARAPASIKVIGVGGGGCNAVRRMLKQPTVGVEYIVANTDVKSLLDSPNVLSIQIGEHLTRGLGAGGDVTVGERAALEGRYALSKALKDAELIFITAGMGGGTGTGAAPVIAEIAKQYNALVVAVVTTPFSFEGKKRFSMALSGIRRLREKVDNIIVIHNDQLLQFTEHNALVQHAFAIADEALAEGVLSVSQLVNVPGEINVDLADVKAIMGIPGGALMAIGRGDGARYPALEAAEQAISNPLLDINLKGAKGLLFNFAGGPDLTLGEVNDAANYISKEVDPDAIIFFGMTAPSEELKNTVKLTLIATGITPALPKSWLAEMGEAVKEFLVGHKAGARR